MVKGAPTADRGSARIAAAVAIRNSAALDRNHDRHAHARWDARLPCTTGELTRRIASGDPEVFTAFYGAWFDFMLTTARTCCGVRGRDENLCLDVVQEAMMRVIRSIPHLESEGELRSWLKAVVRSCAYDQLRREQRRRKREQLVSDRDRHRNGQVDAVELNEQLAWLRRELCRLDAPHATMLRLRHQLGWTLDRIGKAMGLKPGAVDGRLSRLTAQLRGRAGVSRVTGSEQTASGRKVRR